MNKRHQMMRKSVVLICMMLAGCQAAPLARDSGPQSLAGKGVVVLSVTQSPKTMANAVFYLKDREHPNTLRHLEPYIGQLIGKRDFVDPPGALWVIELSPGVHHIDGWAVMYSTGLGEGIFEPRHCPPLSFEVRAGEIVYLGNLHMEIFMARNFFGLKVLGRGHPVFRDERKRDIAKFHEKYPRFEGRQVVARPLDFSAWKIFENVAENH